MQSDFPTCVSKVRSRKKAKGRKGKEDDGEGDPAGDCAGSTRGEEKGIGRNWERRWGTKEVEGEEEGKEGWRRPQRGHHRPIPLNAKGPAGAQHGPTERRVGAP